jgi:N-formylglutamate deformylase
MGDAIWQEELGDGPLVAVAVHAGHDVRREVAGHLALGEADRLREEDPYTEEWTVIAGTRITVTRSRFEVDLNRPRDKAVYRTPEDAWGLRVWQQDPPEDLVAASLAAYDDFYARLRDILEEVVGRHGRFVVLDLHSYNHRREGTDAPAADPDANPQVNVGTGTMDRSRWAPVVNRFLGDLRAYDFPGGGLDVRENVKFQGGHLARWIHESFPRGGCALAIEFKKFFMDEWTGEVDRVMMAAIPEALRSTVPGMLEELDCV